MTDAVIINLPDLPVQRLPIISAFTALRALPSATLAIGDDYAVSGSDAFGDGGGGLFIWVPASTTDDDGATVIKPNDLGPLQAGRWLLAGGKQFKDEIAAYQSALAAPGGAALIGGLIATDRTINVPADYATINAAFAYLRTQTIVTGAIVTIQVANGTYTLASGIDCNHPQGEQIRLIGNAGTPASCVITVSGAPTFDALTVSDGHTLSYLNGFKFNLTAKAAAANNYTAVLAVSGGTIICGPNIVANNWYYGIAARVGSTIVCDSAVVSNAGDVGIWAFEGSAIQCRNAVVSACSDSANLLGWGVEAEYGSAIDCQGANVTTCYRGGIGALSGSTVRALSVNSHDNSGYVNGAMGLFAENGGVIEAHNASVTNNAGFGLYRGMQAMGLIYGNSITNTGNAFGTDSVGMLLDVVGVNGVPRILFYGPTGADIVNANHAPIRVTNGNGTQFEIGDSTTFTVVNHVVALGSATGSHVRLAASGTDSNIDFAIEPKGSGVPRFGGWTTSTDDPITGYITIKDSGGTIRKLAVIS